MPPTRTSRILWEAGIAIVALIAHYLSGAHHLSTPDTYLVWESTTVIAIRFALLAISLVTSFSAIRCGRSPLLFLTVPCFLICCLYTLYWLDYLIRWMLMIHPNPY